eukprot:Gb_39827 [translate_table: standard]
MQHSSDILLLHLRGVHPCCLVTAHLLGIYYLPWLRSDSTTIAYCWCIIIHLPAHIFYRESGTCAAFLANIDYASNATVKFNGSSYDLPAWSVSILPDCHSVIFNTAKEDEMENSKENWNRFSAKLESFVQMQMHVSTQVAFLQTKPASPAFEDPASLKSTSGSIGTTWRWYYEPIGIWGNNSFKKTGLVEQINTTGDSSDYLWYTISVYISDDELKGTQPILHVETLGHALHVFINEEFAELYLVDEMAMMWKCCGNSMDKPAKSMTLSD